MTDETNYTKHANIFEAVAATMNEVGYVKKQRTMGLNYSYAGEAALISALRPVMVDHGIFMYVLKLDDVFQSDFETSKGSKMTRTTLKATIRFQHDGGTFIDVQSAGEGMDSGDKSMNKAMTGAYKYALRQTFCIETGDDPDKHPSPQQATTEKPPLRVAEQPTEQGNVKTSNTTSMTQAAVELGAVVSPLDCDSKGKRFDEMTKGELAGHMTKYAADIKANPADKTTAAKLENAKAALAKLNGK